MKAYYLHMASDDDAGGEIVFANNVKEAKRQAIGQDWFEMSGDLLDLRAHRDKHYDGMEKLSQRDLYKEHWREGWWFHQSGYPDPDEGTDEEFYAWYDGVYGKVDAK